MRNTATQIQASTDAQHYVWWFPGAPIKVHLALDVVSRLRELVEVRSPAGSKAGPLALGQGLLFGAVGDGVTEVLGFRLVTGHAAEKIADAQHVGKDLVVGYFRVEPGQLRLSEADLALSRSALTERHHVIMLIQPAESGPPTASLHFHTADGGM